MNWSKVLIELEMIEQEIVSFGLELVTDWFKNPDSNLVSRRLEIVTLNSHRFRNGLKMGRNRVRKTTRKGSK